MRTILGLTALLALPTTALAGGVGPALDISISDARAGGSFEAFISGAEPSATVFVVLGLGGQGPGVCPPPFQGDCFDIVGPYRIITQTTADFAGQATINLPLPATIPPGTYDLQVAANGSSWVIGNTTTMTVDYLCPDDGLGDNTSIATPFAYTTPITGAITCEGVNGSDWFAITAPDGDTLDVTATFDDAGDGDIDADLYDDLGLEIDSSAGFSDTETLTWTNTTGGDVTVLAEIYAYDDINLDGIVFDLDTATTTPLPPCEDDQYEVNNDPASATTGLLIDTLYSATSCDRGDTVDEDDDWYAFDLVAGVEYTFEAFFSDDDADIDIRLEDAAGGFIASGTSGSDNESVTYTPTLDETVYLNVYMFEEGGTGTPDGAPYDFSVTATVPVP